MLPLRAHRPRPRTEDSDEEFSVRNYEKNVHPSASQVLTQIRGVTPANIQQQLHTARLVSPAEPIHDQICTYVGNSQCHGFGIKILNIIRLARANQPPRLGQNAPASLRNKTRMLLWHGTKEAAVPLILQHGFQPPPARGQMFGNGIYFADRASKSARYCWDTLRDPKPGEVGYMFLCDVLLGKTYNARNAHHEYTTAPTYIDRRGNQRTCDSVKCTGSKIPDKKEKKIIRRNLIIPYGKTVANTRFPQYTTIFNEFIVYSGDRCRPDYLVKFVATGQPVRY